MLRGREILTALFVFVTVCSNTNLNDIMDEEELLFSKSFCKNLYAESSKTMVTALSYPPVLVTNNTHSSSWPESVEEPNCKTGTFHSQMVMDCSEGSPPQQLCKSLALIALLLGIVFSFYYHLE
jgi:hypothetical protein